MVATATDTTGSMNGEEPEQQEPEQLRLSSSDASSAASSLLFTSSFPNETRNDDAAVATPLPIPPSSSPLLVEQQRPDTHENEADIKQQHQQDPPAPLALSSEGTSVERLHENGNAPEAQAKPPEQKHPPAPEPAPPSLSSSERSSTKSNALRFSFLYPKHEQRENAHRSASLPAAMRGGTVTNDEGSSSEPRPRSLSVPERIEMNSEERLRRRREIRQRRRQSQQLLEQITLERERRRRISAYQFNYSRADYPVRELKFKLPFGIVHPVMINPLVTGIAIVWLWGLVVWAASTFYYKRTRRCVAAVKQHVVSKGVYTDSLDFS
jgi:hypothetical protein